MKKLLLLAALLISSFVAQAGPLEDATAAFIAQKGQTSDSDKNHPQATTQTVVRSYFSSQSGIVKSNASIQALGFLATRSQVTAALAQLNYTFLSTQHRMDLYRAAPVNADFGFVLMVYYDTNGYASEIYLIDDAL